PVSELLDTTIEVDPRRHRRLHVTVHRLAVHPHQPGDRAITLPAQPQPRHLFDLEHRDLPESHPAPPARPSEKCGIPRSIGVATTHHRWSHDWQRDGPILVARTRAQLAPCWWRG